MFGGLGENSKRAKMVAAERAETPARQSGRKEKEEEWSGGGGRDSPRTFFDTECRRPAP
jgi:hypothetical protein